MIKTQTSITACDAVAFAFTIQKNDNVIVVVLLHAYVCIYITFYGLFIHVKNFNQWYFAH